MEPAKRARTEFFPTISKIRYEGPESTNPLAFKYYQPDELVMGKKMRQFAMPKPGGASGSTVCTRISVKRGCSFHDVLFIQLDSAEE